MPIFLENGFLDNLADLTKNLILHQVLIGPVFLLFIEESGIPLPVPGDVYLTYVGYQVARNAVPYPVAFISLLITVLLGSSLLYLISSRWGNTLVLRLGKFLHVDEERLLQVEKKFRKYGIWVIIFGRHIPGFRIPITIFSGISHVPYKTFITGTFISIIFWIAFYLSVGEHIGKRVFALFHPNPLSFLLLSLPFIFIVASFFFRNRKKKANK